MVLGKLGQEAFLQAAGEIQLLLQRFGNNKLARHLGVADCQCGGSRQNAEQLTVHLVELALWIVQCRDLVDQFDGAKAFALHRQLRA